MKKVIIFAPRFYKLFKKLINMYAIVNIAGQQFKVETNRKIFVHRLDAEEGSSVEFNEILLIEEDGKVSVGKPYLEGASIVAKVLEHMKGDKVLVFKKKRRKGYQKLNGHRQYMTRIEIEGIFKDGVPSKKAGKKKTVKQEVPETEPQVEITTETNE
jgi:large subunit ribosomal protein L21